MSQDSQPRADREATQPFAETEQASAEPVAPNVEEPARVALGPVSQFFKRRAEFFEQEAMNFAILLEKAYQHGK